MKFWQKALLNWCMIFGCRDVPWNVSTRVLRKRSIIFIPKISNAWQDKRSPHLPHLYLNYSTPVYVSFLLTGLILGIYPQPLAAQEAPIEVKPPSIQPLPQPQPLPELPPPEQLLPTTPQSLTQPDVNLQTLAETLIYELTYRQPLRQTPNQEFTVGITASHQASQTFLGYDDIGAFPLAVGADDQGRTRVSAIRFFQEWTQRSSQQVIATRSQFSFGLGVLGAKINQNEPDSRFFIWRGQAQWLRQLAPDTLVLLQTDMQLADRELLGLEQIGIGGQTTVRGYHQDQLLTDNGVQATAEIRLPIARVAKGVLQLTPFADMGTGWDHGGSNPNTNTLIGTGMGLLWRQGIILLRV